MAEKTPFAKFTAVLERAASASWHDARIVIGSVLAVEHVFPDEKGKVRFESEDPGEMSAFLGEPAGITIGKDAVFGLAVRARTEGSRHILNPGKAEVFSTGLRVTAISGHPAFAFIPQESRGLRIALDGDMRFERRDESAVKGSPGDWGCLVPGIPGAVIWNNCEISACCNIDGMSGSEGLRAGIANFSDDMAFIVPCGMLLGWLIVSAPGDLGFGSSVFRKISWSITSTYTEE
jgi:hypothetical protein